MAGGRNMDSEYADPYELRRYSQMRRVLITIEILRDRRYGLSIEALNRFVNDRMGEAFHYRTTKRDLIFLEAIGYVSQDKPHRGNYRFVEQQRKTIAS